MQPAPGGEPARIEETFSPELTRTLWFTDIDGETPTAFHARIVPESPGVVNDDSGTTVAVD
jgi:hypothetical protein